MKVVIQRVDSAKVEVSGSITGEIENGLLVLLGISKDDATGDTDKKIDTMINKIINMRIFEDEEGKLNKSMIDKNGEILIVPNFTLYGDASKGTRPSYTEALGQDESEKIFNKFMEMIKGKGLKKVQSGKFRAEMKVSLVNDGPVTIVLEI